MYSTRVVSTLMAFTAVAVALPNPRNLINLNLSGQPKISSTITQRSIIDGKCGAGAGSCGPGHCCSQWGYCGTTPDYCSVGCQSSFGTCDSADTGGLSTDHSTSSFLGKGISFDPVTTSVAIVPASTPISSAVAQLPTGLPTNTGGTGLGDLYKLYTGDGSSGWPSQSDWASFDALWAANMPNLQTSCSRYKDSNGQTAPNNSPQEIADLKTAILSVADQAGFDPRFVFVVIMQESSGCVRVHTTVSNDKTVINPGLMQSHHGSGTCNIDGQLSTPCTSSQIQQMIVDGTMGTSEGDGLKQCFGRQSGSDVQRLYKAARCYNSGSIVPSGELTAANSATKCYVSDIANRLTGWATASSSCHE